MTSLFTYYTIPFLISVLPRGNGAMVHNFEENLHSQMVKRITMVTGATINLMGRGRGFILMAISIRETGSMGNATGKAG